MKSMTGYGRSKQHKGNFTVVVEIQSVNRKNLEIGVALPKDYQSLEIDIHRWTKKTVARGKLNIGVNIQEQSASTGFQVDESLVKSSIAKLQTLSSQVGVPFDFDTSDLLRLISMTKSNTQSEPNLEAVTPLLETATQEALDNLSTMRLEEGQHLKADLSNRLQELSNKLDSIKQLAPNVTPRYKSLLEDRLKTLGPPIDLEDERLLKEIALFADKCDISEEITRLQCHLDQFKKDLGMEGVIGRKLDFLCQEINREWNTIGSKANLFQITQIVIEAKNELERIREQVQNIE